MSQPLKVAIIGLDTSHSTALPQLMQDPDTPQETRVPELTATRCLRFSTPFQNEEGLDKRQNYLESIGVKVTTDFDEAVADCDAIMLEINDPTRHEEYFAKCAPLGKPVFLDKPFAHTVESMRRIIDAAKTHGTRFFTSSSLRFDVDFQEALAKNVTPDHVQAWGPIGQAPAGSSLIWYGCHTFEMLQRAIGHGAVTVTGSQDDRGFVFHVAYNDGRRGVVELTKGVYKYGALIRDNANACALACVTGRIPFYQMLLKEIVAFLNGAQPVSLEDAFEVMAMLEAAEKSIQNGAPQPVETFG